MNMGAFKQLQNSSRIYLTGQVIAVYCQVRRIPQDCVPDQQGKTAGALHLTIFEQPEKEDFFSSRLDVSFPKCKKIWTSSQGTKYLGKNI